MTNDPMMQPQALQERNEKLRQEAAAGQQVAMEREAARQQEATSLEQARLERETALSRQATLDREAERTRQAELARAARETAETAEQQDPIQGTLGGRDASTPKTPFGDRDAPRERFPGYELSPSASRAPIQDTEAGTPDNTSENQDASPWRRSIHHGQAPDTEDTIHKE